MSELVLVAALASTFMVNATSFESGEMS
jgi:hypothetical protein